MEITIFSQDSEWWVLHISLACSIALFTFAGLTVLAKEKNIKLGCVAKCVSTAFVLLICAVGDYYYSRLEISTSEYAYLHQDTQDEIGKSAVMRNALKIIKLDNKITNFEHQYYERLYKNQKNLQIEAEDKAEKELFKQKIFNQV